MLFFTVFAQDLSPEIKACITACNSDVNCQAKCLGVPFPDESLALETSQCITECGDDIMCRVGCEQTYVMNEEVVIDPDTNEVVERESANEKDDDGATSNSEVSHLSTMTMLLINF